MVGPPRECLGAPRTGLVPGAWLGYGRPFGGHRRPHNAIIFLTNEAWVFTLIHSQYDTYLCQIILVPILPTIANTVTVERSTSSEIYGGWYWYRSVSFLDFSCALRLAQ